MTCERPGIESKLKFINNRFSVVIFPKFGNIKIYFIFFYKLNLLLILYIIFFPFGVGKTTHSVNSILSSQRKLGERNFS